MLKTLIKKQLLELFQTYYIDKKSGKAKSRTKLVFFLILMAVLFIGLGAAFYFMSAGIGSLVIGTELSWLYFALTGLIAIALGVFGSVFNTYASLYLPKDNELLISLPIPTSKLVLARLSGVIATSFMYSAWVWIPAMIAYYIMAEITFSNLVASIIMMFVIALFVAVLSSVLGLFVAMIASKTKGKSFIAVISSLVFIALYYVVYFKIVNSLNELGDYIGAIGTSIKSRLHFIYLMGSASEGNWFSLIIVTAITLVLAYLSYLLITKTFNKFANVKQGRIKNVKKEEYVQTGLRKTLLKRELKHFTSESTWMLNGGLGLVIMPALAIGLFIKKDQFEEVIYPLKETMPEIYSNMPIIIVAMICVILSINCILTIAVSVEGKSIWILQSLPIDPWEILKAKESMGVKLNIIPTMFFAVSCCIMFKFEILESILVLVSLYMFIYLLQNFALFLDLKKLNLNWTNVATLTKQSMQVLINLFGGWLFSVVIGFGGFFLANAIGGEAVLVIYIALFAVLYRIIHRWIKIKGTELFAFA